MTGWNMPPGCNPSDIPGNRLTAEDEERRISACLNSCEGIPTAALEAGAVERLVEAAERILTYRRQAGPLGFQLEKEYDYFREIDAALEPFRRERKEPR